MGNSQSQQNLQTVEKLLQQTHPDRKEIQDLLDQINPHDFYTKKELQYLNRTRLTWQFYASICKNSATVQRYLYCCAVVHYLNQDYLNAYRCLNNGYSKTMKNCRYRHLYDLCSAKIGLQHNCEQIYEDCRASECCSCDQCYTVCLHTASERSK